MPEVTVKYKSEDALKALHDHAKDFDMEIEQSTEEQNPGKEQISL